MIALHFAPGAGSLTPHIFRGWIGEPHETGNMAFGSKKRRAATPIGAVAILPEGGRLQLRQAGAILAHLAHRHRKAGLTGGDTLQGKAKAPRGLSYFTSDMHAAFWSMFGPGKYTTDAGDAAKHTVIAAEPALMRKRLGLLDAYLKARQWELGDRSVINAFPMIRWGIMLLPGRLKGYANVRDRICAGPSSAASAGNRNRGLR